MWGVGAVIIVAAQCLAWLYGSDQKTDLLSWTFQAGPGRGLLVLLIGVYLLGRWTGKEDASD